jgi:hypothetical protein
MPRDTWNPENIAPKGFTCNQIPMPGPALNVPGKPGATLGSVQNPDPVVVRELGGRTDSRSDPVESR